MNNSMLANNLTKIITAQMCLTNYFSYPLGYILEGINAMSLHFAPVFLTTLSIKVVKFITF